ncbi:MAG: hypothetical protein A2Y34_05860 [Spirochaetes bacterium GWC1_27_15]|nr:MAG: hypothetical protein A2Z98_09180 [Spirochaetes bacterium GWB1_27_13]OHD24788.1 MAG: hypothetical protein A2Y34_05860 [Spirochaetes bacterium GWC1_27_15]
MNTKFSIKGKLVGFALGILISSNILGGLIGLLIGHILFDRLATNDNEEYFIEDSLYVENTNIITFIIKLCYGLVNQKEDILLTEVDTIKQFLRKEFGIDKLYISKVDLIFSNLMDDKSNLNVDSVIHSINHYCSYDEKQKIIELLFVVAVSDKNISKEEIDYIHNVYHKLKVKLNDYLKIKNKFIKEELEYYKILGVNESATDAEIKTAYRKLVNLHHPDKVKEADYDKEKFQQIVKAYNELKKFKRIH